MRPFIMLTVGFFIIAIVFAVVIFAPSSKQDSGTISRIDFDRQPQPVIQSDPGGDYILEFFPDPKDFTPEDFSADLQDKPLIGESTENQPGKSPLQEVQKERDKNLLLALINDWQYTDFIQVSTAKKGTILKTRDNVYLSISEGEHLESGIVVDSLNDEAALLALGDATFLLRRARQPSFYEEVKRTLRPLTPDEQAQAYDYYMRVYGDKFKESSKGYKPPLGAQMPRRVDKQQQLKGLEEYYKRYGKQFKNENSKYTQQFNGSEKQREAYKKYWEQFGGGIDRPKFDEIFGKAGSTGPGARIVPEGALKSPLPLGEG